MLLSMHVPSRRFRVIHRTMLAMALPLLLAGCLFVPVAHEKPISPTFVGVVRDARTGAPIAGAQVRVIANQGGERAPVESSTRTGPDGAFRLVATRTSRWFYVVLMLEGTCAADIRVTADGYEPLSRSVGVWSNGAINGLCRGVVERIDLPLEPKRSAAGDTNWPMRGVVRLSRAALALPARRAIGQATHRPWAYRPARRVESFDRHNHRRGYP